MVAVRTRSRRARQKVSDGNPRSGADRGGRANKARAPASSSPGDSRSSECSRVDTGRRRRLAASSAGDFDLGRGRRATKDDGLGASAQITQPQTGFWLFRDRVAAEQGAICGFCSLALTRQTRSLPRRRRESTPEMPRTKHWRNHCEREMPRSISHDGFDAKFNVEATVLQVSRDSRTRAAVEPSCTTTRATRADRGPQARVKNYFIQPRPTSEIQHDAAATNASKRSLKAF